MILGDRRSHISTSLRPTHVKYGFSPCRLFKGSFFNTRPDMQPLLDVATHFHKHTYTVEGSAERVHSTTSVICIFPLQNKPGVCSLSSQTHHLPTLRTASESDLLPVLWVLWLLGVLRFLPSTSNLHFVHQAAASPPVLLRRRVKKTKNKNKNTSFRKLQRISGNSDENLSGCVEARLSAR